MEMQLNEDFGNIWNRFDDSKLSIQFRKDKMKFILFVSKRKITKFLK